jgi:uncharacterized protein (TIGR02328 family)
MRLWHEALLKDLPVMQLRGQHRECCALRGKGWGRKHKTVDYVFTHPMEMLVAYHLRLIDELERQNLMEVDPKWKNIHYRGKILGCEQASDYWTAEYYTAPGLIYPEHNEDYMQECLDNLKGKGHDIRRS